MGRIFKILAWNVVLIAVAIITADLIFGHWISYVSNRLFNDDPASRFTERYYDTVFVHCPDEFLHHVYCPEISHLRTMSEGDGGQVIVNYVNRSSLRVGKPRDMVTTTNTAEYDVINIGDSFLQADEIPFDDTLSRVMAAKTGKTVLQVGFASWAPINYRAWLRHNPLKRGVEVNIFVMTNDVLPNYEFSNVRYHEKGSVGADGEVHFDAFGVPLPVELKHLLAMNSAIYRLLRRTRDKMTEDGPETEPTDTYDTFGAVLTAPVSDCSRKTEFENIAPLTRDYVRLAFDAQCWNEELKTNVDSGVSDLRAAVDTIKAAGGVARIFVIPAAWAFVNEGKGAKNHPVYKMAPDSAITTGPLVTYLADAFKDDSVEVVSLEAALRGIKAQHSERLYFPFDSHWNETAHALLGEWLAARYP